MKKIIGEKETQIEILQKTVDEIDTSDKVEGVESLDKRGYSVYYQSKQEQAKDNTKSSVSSGIPAFDENRNVVSEQEVIELVKEYAVEYSY